MPKTLFFVAALILFVGLPGARMSLHALAAEADKTIQYKSPPVGTKLIYGPLKDSISVTEIDENPKFDSFVKWFEKEAAVVFDN